MEYKQKNDISTSIEGMRKWAELMAETLGVTPDDITRTSGCELEFLVISENKAAFRKRLTELKKDGYRGYVKESEYMPKALRPTKWQAKLEKAKISRSSRGKQKTGFAHVIENIDKFTMEPSSYISAIDIERIAVDPTADDFLSRDDAFPRTYLNAEIVSKPIASPEASARWLSGIGQYILNIVQSKKAAYLDFRSKPTSSAHSNSTHMHLGMYVSLRALVASPKFSHEQRIHMLERNVRFYRERVQESGNNVSGQDIKTCLAMEEACRKGASIESILEDERYREFVKNIRVNMFSRRELEKDTLVVDATDLEEEAARRAVDIKIPREIITDGSSTENRLLTSQDTGCTRRVGTDEISQFGVMFARTLEQFNHDCALVVAPAETSYQRFLPFNNSVSPAFNAGAQRKTLGIYGAYLFRGAGRISYGQYNPEGQPDKGDIRVEARIMASEVIGHPNHAYPNQRVMPYELQEGIEAVFALTSQHYTRYLRGEVPPLSEGQLFDTYNRCVEALPKGRLLNTIVPEGQQLPRHKDKAIERFFAPDGMAETIYGTRREDMVARRGELDKIIETDFHSFNGNPGPQEVHTALRDIGVSVNEKPRGNAVSK